MLPCTGSSHPLMAHCLNLRSCLSCTPRFAFLITSRRPSIAGVARLFSHPYVDTYLLRSVRAVRVVFSVRVVRVVVPPHRHCFVVACEYVRGRTPQLTSKRVCAGGYNSSAYFRTRVMACTASSHACSSPQSLLCSASSCHPPVVFVHHSALNPAILVGLRRVMRTLVLFRSFLATDRSFRHRVIVFRLQT